MTVLFFFLGAQAVYAGITVTPTTWNVIGLDSNRVNNGPDTFPVGVRVCNAGGAAINNVVGNFIWDSANSYINLSEADTLTVSSLAAGACVDLYFPVVITRTSLAYNAKRRFHITVSADGVAAVSTPTPRELYVEKLVSQSRNTVTSITGPTTVYVGQTYTYTTDTETATQGYEQLEAFLTLSNVLFQVQGVATTYTSPTSGTNNKIYADACGWENNPTSGNYRSCVGPENYAGGKAGGTVRTTYTVKVLSTGTTTIASMIYDFSGSSYHYNSDYGERVLSVTALPPPVPNVLLTKSAAQTGAQMPGADIDYQIAFTNNGTASAANLVINDPIPTNTDFKVGSATANTGTSGLSISIVYSNDNGTTYLYTPASGGGGAPAGYDRAVTNIRWTFTGTLSQTSPNNTGSVGFTVRIR